MRIDFPLPQDDREHTYCTNCIEERGELNETVRRVTRGGRTYYACWTCGKVLERALVIDPGITWWVGDDGEYWHESVGVCVSDEHARLLLFQRTIFPFRYTMPAGHLDRGEDPRRAAARELSEETGLRVDPDDLTLAAEEDVIGDECRRGADRHYWHLYKARVPAESIVVGGDEGLRPEWVPFDRLGALDTTYPVRYFRERLGTGLLV